MPRKYTNHLFDIYNTVDAFQYRSRKLTMCSFPQSASAENLNDFVDLRSINVYLNVCNSWELRTVIIG